MLTFKNDQRNSGGTLQQKETKRRKRRTRRKKRKRRKRRKIMENLGTSWNIMDQHGIEN